MRFLLNGMIEKGWIVIERTAQPVRKYGAISRLASAFFLYYPIGSFWGGLAYRTCLFSTGL